MILHLCTKNLDMIYSSGDIRCYRLKLVIMGHFLPFYPPSPENPKNQNFKKIKTAGDTIILHMCTIIILHMCTKTHHHMSYGS